MNFMDQLGESPPSSKGKQGGTLAITLFSGKTGHPLHQGSEDRLQGGACVGRNQLGPSNSTFTRNPPLNRGQDQFHL